MNMPNKEQIKELGAHVLTAAGTAVTVLGLLNVMPADQLHVVSHAIPGIAAGVSDIYKGVCEVGIAVGPLVAMGAMWWSAWTKSHPQMLSRTAAVTPKAGAK